MQWQLDTAALQPTNKPCECEQTNGDRWVAVVNPYNAIATHAINIAEDRFSSR